MLKSLGVCFFVLFVHVTILLYLIYNKTIQNIILFKMIIIIIILLYLSYKIVI